MKNNSIIFSDIPPQFKIFPNIIPGVHRISTEIRNLGLTCQVIHHFSEFTDAELDTVLTKLISDETQIVGFSTNFWGHATAPSILKIIKPVSLIIEWITQHYPNIRIIFGGASARIAFEHPFKKIDAIFEGFSDAILKKYVKSIRDGVGEPTPNELINDIKVYRSENNPDNFDFNTSKIAFHADDHIQFGSTSVIETARGCIFKCKFCAFPLNGKDKFDYIKDGETLRDELIDNYEKYGIKYYILGDDTFNDSTFKVELLHKVFTSLPFKIKFSCYLRLDLLNAHREQIPLLKEMGLVGTFFGIETFHHKAGQAIGKGMDPAKAKHLLNELKTIHWPDIKISVGIIIGLPYETLESYEHLIDWINDPNNLVEMVNCGALKISNPLTRNIDPNLSLFQTNALDYGFYWNSNDCENWKNLNGPVKDRKHAFEITDKVNQAIKKSSRTLQGGFNMFQLWNLASFIDTNITMEKLIEMDRFEYEKYVCAIVTKSNKTLFYKKYKEGILLL